MSSKKRAVIVGSLLVCFMMVLIPPSKSGSYVFIFNTTGFALDITRLAVQFVLVCIAAGAVYMSIGGEQKTLPDTSEEPKLFKIATISLVSMIALALFAFIGIESFKAYSAWQEEQRKKEIELTNQKLALLEAEKQREADRLEQEATNRRNLVQAQAAAEAAAHRLELGKQKVWTPQRTKERSVTASPITYWRDDSMVIRFQLSGPAEYLEIASGKHKSYQVVFLTREGLEAESLSFNPSELRRYKGKSGAITIMATNPRTSYCDQNKYESFKTWKLIESSM